MGSVGLTCLETSGKNPSQDEIFLASFQVLPLFLLSFLSLPVFSVHAFPFFLLPFSKRLSGNTRESRVATGAGFLRADGEAGKRQI